MTTQTQPGASTTAASTTVETFDSTSPATGAVVGTFPVDDEAAVHTAVRQAREAADWWRELGFDGRARRLRALRRVIVRRRDELLDLIHRENGKPTVDAWIEQMLVVDYLSWLIGHAEKVLRPRRAGASQLLFNFRGQVEYQPLGVVGVIGPWNYPLYTPMGSIAFALAAGNAVVFKPSEQTPAVGRWIADAVAEVCPEQPVVQVVTGFGETGAALCRSGVNKVAFTGSAPTGRTILTVCAETLTPVLLELGGKDPMIVDDDADVDAAARAALWGGCSNAGQTCIGVERVYATDAVYDRLIAAMAAAARSLRVGPDADADLGPITMPGQLDVIRRHLDDALDHGARAVVGGRKSVHPPYVDPVVLVDIADDALLLREETFGPIVPVIRVRDADEALARANASPFGLGSTVYGERRAVQLARRLRSGMTSVNSVLGFAGFASLPFGGVGESGFGRIHGPDGLKEFTRAKSIAVQRFPLPFEMLSFDRPAWLPKALQKVEDYRYGR